MNDLIRKEFEEACESQFNWSLQDPFRDKGEATLSSWEGEKYGNRIVQGMWWAWQSSREKIEFDAGEGADETHHPLSVEEFWIEQIKSKGLKVKHDHATS